MKKILCYLGILVLLILGVLPPVLRNFYKEDSKKEEIKEVETAILFCKNDIYTITTSYEDDDVKKIAIKKLIANNEENNNIQENLEDDKIIDKTDMDLLFDSLQENQDLIHSTLEDGEVVGIDFTTSKYEGIDLSNLTKSKDEQKKYYENLKLTCTIRK